MNPTTNRFKKLSFFLLFTFLMSAYQPLSAQNLTKTFSGKTLKKSSNATIVDNFSEYTIVDFDLRSFNDLVHPKNSRNANFTGETVQLKMGQYDWTFELYPDNIFSDDFQLTTIENGKRTTIPINRNKTFMGYLKGTSDEVRLTIDDDFLSGVVYQNGKPIYIEPLSRFEQNARPNQLIIYEAEKVLSPALSCAHNESSTKMEELEQGTARFLTNQCYEIRLGIATDATVFTNLTNVAAVNNFTTAVFNNIRPIYRFAFGDNIEFLIAQQFVSQATANDPFSPNNGSTDATTLLNQFGAWMVGNGFGTTNIDIGSVWVSRNIFLSGQQAAGVANFAICTPLSNRTQIIQYDANSSASGYTCLVAHETGHNFFADHVNGANIMNPSCSSSLVWDPSTVTTITNRLNTADCTSGGNALIACATNPVATIGGSTAACIGQSITLKDQSQHGATRTWSSPNANITSGSATEHTVSYAAAGTYTVSLTSTNGTGNNTTTASILVGNAPVAICPPSPNTGQGDGGISRFALANLDKSSPSGAALNEKLEDFACSDIVELSKSTSYTLKSLTIVGGVSQSFKIYIDYNNDGDFVDAGESVLPDNNVMASGDIATFLPSSFITFTTPSNPVENQLLRMRVIVDNGNITPCLNPAVGQMEDYGVIFKAAIPCPTGLANTTAPKIGITNSTCSTTGSFTAISCATGSTAQYSTDNGTTWNAALPTYSATSAMTILSRCNCSSDNSISSMTNTATTAPVIKPTVTKPADQTVSAGNMTTEVTFSGTTNATYTWTNDNTNTGIAASGSGNMPAYTATNTGIAAIVSTITVTPTLNGCAGTPQTFKITVNPPAPQCSITNFNVSSINCKTNDLNSNNTDYTICGSFTATNTSGNYEFEAFHQANIPVKQIVLGLAKNGTINFCAEILDVSFTPEGFAVGNQNSMTCSATFASTPPMNCPPRPACSLTGLNITKVCCDGSGGLRVVGSFTAANGSGNYRLQVDGVPQGGFPGPSQMVNLPSTVMSGMVNFDVVLPSFDFNNIGSGIYISDNFLSCFTPFGPMPPANSGACTSCSAPTCAANVTLDNVVATRDTAASATITTQNAVVISGTVTFSAPSITLNAGFSVPTGQVFATNTTGCTAPQPLVGTTNRNRLLDYQLALASSSNLIIYPNPATQFINLDFKVKGQAPVEIGLYNLNGKLVKSIIPIQRRTEGQHQTKVDVSAINSGMYFIILRQAGQIQTKKLVISQ